MKFALAIIGALVALVFTVVVGTLFGVGRIPGVVEPGYLHPDDLKDQDSKP